MRAKRYPVETTHCIERFGDDVELTVRADVVVQRPMGRSAPSSADCYGYADVDGLVVLLGDRDVTDELTKDEVELLTEACEELGREADRDSECDYADHLYDRWKDERLGR